MVCLLLASLAFWGWIELSGMTDCTICGQSKADVKTLEISVIRYRTMTNMYPASLEDLARKPENYAGNWRALVNPSALNDPWGEHYQYRNPGLKNPNGYDLFTKGPDKKEGTPDDIGNW